MNPRILIKAFLLIALASVHSVGAQEDGLLEEELSISAHNFAQALRQYRAFGTHQCQSHTAIGHTCGVTGIFPDCNAAFLQLRNDDCCGTTKDGGTSIKFNLDSCGIFAQPG